MAITQITRSELDILRDTRENLLENVGISADNQTSTSLNLARSMAREVSSMWDTMNSLLRNNFITTAFGDSLDEIGELLQEPRDNAKRAMDLSSSNIKFYIDESFAADITDLLLRYLTVGDRTKLYTDEVIDSIDTPTQISLGDSITVSSMNGEATYTTTTAITLSNTQLFDYSPVIANSVGTSANVSAGVLTIHNIGSSYPTLSKVINAIKVKNLFGIRNGGDTENDENYRFRLSNKVVSAVAGNESSIRKAVLAVPGIVDMSLIVRTHGNGTLTIFPKSVDPILSDGLMMAVRSSVDSVKSIGTLVYVEAPEYLALLMKLELRFKPSANKNALIANARLTTMDYINNLGLGGEVVINEIIQRVMSLDDNIIDMNIAEFGYGFYGRQNGEITSYIPLRTMNQMADYNQQWFTNANMCNICETGTR